jgi:hypothetical protein
MPEGTTYASMSACSQGGATTLHNIAAPNPGAMNRLDHV